MRVPHAKTASALAILCLAFGAACDLVVPDGQELVIGVGSAAFGSSADPDGEARPAVRVERGGRLRVEGGQVFGGSQLPQDPLPPPMMGVAAAPGILAQGGNVRVTSGMVQGGSVVFREGARGFALVASGIDATDSRVEIEGGLVMGGAGVAFQGDPQQGLFRRPALLVTGGSLRVAGGTVMPGVLSRDFGSPPPLVIAAASSVEITGGSFLGRVQLASSPSVIRGGSFQSLLVGTRFATGLVLDSFPFVAFPDSSGSEPATCIEIRGGSFESIDIQGRQTVMFFGQFTLPFGQTSFVFRALAPVPQAQGFPPPPPLPLLAGTLENGAPASIRVTGELGSVAILAPAGAPGCP